MKLLVTLKLSKTNDILRKLKLHRWFKFFIILIISGYKLKKNSKKWKVIAKFGTFYFVIVENFSILYHIKFLNYYLNGFRMAYKTTIIIIYGIFSMISYEKII